MRAPAGFKYTPVNVSAKGACAECLPSRDSLIGAPFFANAIDQTLSVGTEYIFESSLPKPELIPNT